MLIGLPFFAGGQTIEESAIKLAENATAIENVVNGPSSGVGSVVTLPQGGTQDSLAKMALQFDVTVEGFIIPAGAIPNDGLDDSAAFQAHLDTGASLYIKDGVYNFSTGLILKYKGQVIKGQSIGGTSLLFDAMPVTGKAFSVVTDPNDAGTRIPGASTSANNYGTIEQLYIRGPGRLTASYGIWTQPADDLVDPEVTWQGDAITFRNLWVTEFGTGMRWNTPNKYFLENCLFKQCEIGLYATNKGALDVPSATANALLLHHVHVTECTTGLLMEGADAVITLGDASVADKLVHQIGGNLHITGGQLEQCVTVLQNDGGSASFKSASLLSTEGNVPIVLTGRASVEVANITVFFAAAPPITNGTTPLIWLTENSCTAFGTPGHTLYFFSSMIETKYQVRLWMAPDVSDPDNPLYELVHLTPFPTRPGATKPTKVDHDNDGGTPSIWNDASRGHIFYALDEANDRGDDLRMLIRSGISTIDDNDPYAEVSLIRPNNLIATQEGTFMDITGIERYFFAAGTATGSRTVRLPRILNTGAIENNAHVVTIIDKDGNASANNITIALQSTDATNGEVIYGGTSITTDFGSATFLTNGNDWYQIK